MNWSEAKRLTCPRCGAPPHSACMGKRGPRQAHHAERYNEKRDIGYRSSMAGRARARDQRCNVPGWVYFIAASGTGSVKIGFSADSPASRLKSLQTGNPHDLEVIGQVQGTRRDEQRLHERFAHLRVRGEWFRDGADLREFLDSLIETVP